MGKKKRLLKRKLLIARQAEQAARHPVLSPPEVAMEEGPKAKAKKTSKKRSSKKRSSKK